MSRATETASNHKRNKLFGTDGVRGLANEFPMTVETAVALGRAAGKVFRKSDRRTRVVIGKDTRLSCYMFENALIAGLCSMGVDTLMVGPFPTPGIAFITRAYRAEAGIIISASHNPYHDNGIKFFSSEGYKFSDEWERQIEELVAKNDFSDDLPAPHEIGSNKKVYDARGRYIEYAKATFPKNLDLTGIKIALDCAHGAGYRVAPLIFEELGAEVIVYGNEPNGQNINKETGALHPETVQKAVIEHHADVGIALDGDADRVIMVDEHAQVIDGDMILGICANDLKGKGELKNDTLVCTAMSNFGFKKAMEERGIQLVEAQVGDRYVIQQMRTHDANLGGEKSGHVIFLDHNTTGDALVAALQVLRIMKERDASLSDLASFIKPYPQVVLNVNVREKRPLETLSKVQEAIKKAEKDLGDDGRVLVRYSGTEKICRVMIEGSHLRTIQSLAELIAEAVAKSIGTQVL